MGDFGGSESGLEAGSERDRSSVLKPRFEPVVWFRNESRGGPANEKTGRLLARRTGALHGAGRQRDEGAGAIGDCTQIGPKLPVLVPK